MRTRDGGVEVGGGESSETGSVTEKGRQFVLRLVLMPASPWTSGIQRRATTIT